MSGYVAGAIGGIVGGLAIAALGMASGAASGRGLWTLPNSVSGIILCPRRAEAKVFGVATLVGAALHIVLSAVFGIVIVLLAQNLTHAYLATGLVGGATLWLINYLGIGAIHLGAHQVAKLNPAPSRSGFTYYSGSLRAVSPY